MVHKPVMYNDKWTSENGHRGKKWVKKTGCYDFEKTAMANCNQRSIIVPFDSTRKRLPKYFNSTVHIHFACVFSCQLLCTHELDVDLAIFCANAQRNHFAFFFLLFLFYWYVILFATAVLLKLDVYGRKFVINRGRDAWHISNAGIVHSFQIDVNINI